MKIYNLMIINSKDKLLDFKVFEPDTVEEAMAGIKDSTYEDGMVLFAIKPDIVIQPSLVQDYRSVPLDIISVDWQGNIKEIHKNVLPEDHATLYANSVCIVEIKAGVCDRYEISVGDTVVHEKLKFLPLNKIRIYDAVFEKATPEKLSGIKTEDIMFLWLIRVSGYETLSDTALIITRTGKLYYVDLSSEKYKSMLADIFPSFTNKDCCDNYYELACETINTLFVHKDYYKRFMDLLGEKELKGDWIKSALKTIN